jgi:rhodanese-related sulfurtransferase
MSLKNLMLLALSVLLVIGIMVTGGCVDSKTTTPNQTLTQIIENVTPPEAFTLIQDNENNPEFVILDVRTPEEFADGYIENAINLDYYSETFRDELNKLDKNKKYLIYCRSGNRSGKALAIMAELNFREVYNMLGGIVEWEAEGLPMTT